jgi:hypothetical protein
VWRCARAYARKVCVRVEGVRARGRCAFTRVRCVCVLRACAVCEGAPLDGALEVVRGALPALRREPAPRARRASVWCVRACERLDEGR